MGEQIAVRKYQVQRSAEEVNLGSNTVLVPSKMVSTGATCLKDPSAVVSAGDHDIAAALSAPACCNAGCFGWGDRCSVSMIVSVREKVPVTRRFVLTVKAEEGLLQLAHLSTVFRGARGFRGKHCQRGLDIPTSKGPIRDRTWDHLFQNGSRHGTSRFFNPEVPRQWVTNCKAPVKVTVSYEL
jgi:hypothetical protein